MVDPRIISGATLEGKIYDGHNYTSTDVYNIDSILREVQRTYDRAKEARQKFGSRSTLHAINDATKQLNMVIQKKQELEKKKLVI
jgi:hypothetical protein